MGTLYREVCELERRKKKDPDPFYELSQVASVTECTGLMPSLPQNEEEDENYAGLYATHDTHREKPSGCNDIPSSPV